MYYTVVDWSRNFKNSKLIIQVINFVLFTFVITAYYWLFLILYHKKFKNFLSIPKFNVKFVWSKVFLALGLNYYNSVAKWQIIVFQIGENCQILLQILRSISLWLANIVIHFLTIVYVSISQVWSVQCQSTVFANNWFDTIHRICDHPYCLHW